MPRARLTDKAVQAAKADAGERLEIWDVQTAGLCLRVSGIEEKDGKVRQRKVWVWRYRTDDGRQPRLTLGDYSDAYSLADARADVERRRVEVRNGADPSGEKRRAKAEAKAQPIKTLSDLAAIYFTACETGEWKPRGKKKRASTLSEERGLWRRHIKADLGDLRVEDVTPDAIRKRLRSLLAKGHGVTSNRVRSLLRQLFNFAINEERILLNPVAKVQALGTETARARVLSDAELKLAWSAIIDPSGLKKPAGEGEEAAQVYIGEAVSIALRLLLLTLTRRFELAGMRLDELDLAQGSWTIPGERTKNGIPLLVPLSADAKALVERAIEIARTAKDANEHPSPFVFPSPRDRAKPITPAALSHALRDLRLALAATRFTPHDFRRTAATIMASERLGISPFLIGRLLNHTTEQGGAAAVTQAHYNLHDYAQEKRRALQGWADLLMEIVGERAQSSNVARLEAARKA